MSALKFFKLQFLTCLAVLAVVKLTFIGILFLSPDAGTTFPAGLLKSIPMLFGADILGALLVSAVFWLLLVPLVAFGWPRGALVLAGLLQSLHGLLAAASTLGIVYAGGPLNKQTIESTWLGLVDAGEGGVAAIGGSFSDYLSPLNLGFLLLMAVAGPLVLRYLVRRWGGRTASKRATLVVVALLALEVAGTYLALPVFQSGAYTARLPVATQAEGSPVVELVWSYAKPMLRCREQVPIADPFVLDQTARHEAVPLVPPLEGAVPKRTNVILVLMESIGDAYLEYPQDPMPFFRSLAARPGSAWLASHYSTWALTTAAMFSALCSEFPYPSHLPITTINPGAPCVCIMDALKAAGYRTLYMDGQDLRWDRLHIFMKYHPVDALWDSRNMPRPADAWFGKWGIDDAVSVDNILALPELSAPEPFFLMFTMVSGHHPFFASREQEASPVDSREGEYLRALSYADRQLKRLYEGLAAKGILENTLLVFVSDHGEGHGRNVGRNVYEPVVKVPVLFTGPQLGGIQRTVTRNTSHLDLAPTILGLVGVPRPCTMKGRDLRIDGSSRVAFFGSRPPLEQFGVIDGSYKLIADIDGKGTLFDVKQDPIEENDLSRELPDIAAELRNRLMVWKAFSENLIENYAEIRAISPCR